MDEVRRLAKKKKKRVRKKTKSKKTIRRRIQKIKREKSGRK